MNATKDTRIFTERGYAVQGQVAYGSENDVPFTLTLAAKQAVVQFALDRNMDGAEKSAVKAALKEKGFRALFGAGVMSAVIKADKTRPGESILEGLCVVIATILECGVPFSVECHFCGNRDADAFMLCPQKSGRPVGYRAVHQSCTLAAHAEVEEKAARNEGSYLTGILGALLGTIVGALPTVFTIWQMNTIYALVCALVPLGAFYGYKLFKGKMNAVSIIATIVFSVLGAFAIQAGLDILDSMLNYGATFAQSVEYLVTYLPVDPDYRAYFFSSLVQVLLFVGLGIIVCSGIFRRTNKGEAKTFAAMRATLRLKPGAAPVAEAQGPYFDGGQTEGM